MANFSEIVQITHVLFGMLCIVTGLWVFVDTLNASDTNQTRIRGLSVAVAVLMWLAYLIGGYWYVTLYNTDKALLLKGPWPFAHTFFMEVREHVVLILLLLATYLPIAASSNLSANRTARSKTVFMSASYHRVAAVIGLVLILGGTTVWGAQPPNNDVSDGSSNTAGGTEALASLGSGYANTAFGFEALQYNTFGSYNTATGAFALQYNNGDYNTASGVSALGSNTTGKGNTANGSSALSINTTGNNNTATGAWALQTNDTGNNNTASGTVALQNNTTGSGNTASGAFALQNNTTGGGNTASGVFALRNNNGDDNTASGAEALGSNTTGNNNTANGSSALQFNTTGRGNTASGAFALDSNTIGNNNTALGFQTLLKSTGSSNIAIGTNAGLNLKSGNTNIYLGNNQGAATESKTMRLGSAQTRTFIAGIAGTPIAGTSVVITSNGQLGTIVSSARYKEHIQDMGERSRQVLDLRPVTFHYKQDSEGSKQYGLIAEEVDQVYPELVTHTATGEAESVQYHALIPMLLNELQRQQQQIDVQTQQLTVQAQQIAAVKAQSAALADRLMQLEKQGVPATTLTSR